MAGTSAIARRALSDSRVRTISFALLFLLSALTQATAYREGYPTVADRLDFARSVGENDAARLLYGMPHDLLSVGGYVSWRVGGSLAILAAIWALLGAVRAMRAEEDSGRAELVLAGTISRRKAFVAQLAAIGAGATILGSHCSWLFWPVRCPPAARPTSRSPSFRWCRCSPASELSPVSLPRRSAWQRGWRPVCW